MNPYVAEATAVLAAFFRVYRENRYPSTAAWRAGLRQRPERAPVNSGR